MSQAQAPAADWYPDPSGRFQFRYWDGQAWSGHVSIDGKTDWDPPGAPPAGIVDTEQPEEQRPEPTPQEPAGTEHEEADHSATDIDDGEGPEGEASIGDVNKDANSRAQLSPEVAEWLDEVAAQVEPRLERISPNWNDQPQSQAAPACAYGLLLGHLARIHPHMRSDLSLVAEAHPSFSTIDSGSRLDTLDDIAGDPRRAAAWLGPLIGVEDPDRIRMLFD